MTLKEKIFENLHCTQWDANLIGWWDINVVNHKTKKDLLNYLKEADDKVWLMLNDLKKMFLFQNSSWFERKIYRFNS